MSCPEELREQVEETRQGLGQTVEALAAETDIKARAQEEAADVKQRGSREARQLKAKAAETAQVQDKLPDLVKDKAVNAAEQTRDEAAPGVPRPAVRARARRRRTPPHRYLWRP